MLKKTIFPSSGRCYENGYIAMDAGDNVANIYPYFAIVAHGYLSDIWLCDKSRVICAADTKEECIQWAQEHGYTIEHNMEER